VNKNAFEKSILSNQQGAIKIQSNQQFFLCIFLLPSGEKLLLMQVVVL